MVAVAVAVAVGLFSSVHGRMQEKAALLMAFVGPRPG